MGESQVHPAVFIEIERHNSSGGQRHVRGRFCGPWRSGAKCAFALIDEGDGRLLPAGDDEVDGAVVVQIGAERANRRCDAAQRGFLGPVGESPVAIVAPENISGRRCVRWKWEGLTWIVKLEFVEARDVEIEIAVVVVVDKCEAEREAIAC